MERAARPDIVRQSPHGTQARHVKLAVRDLSNEAVVLGVRPDPEPGDVVILQKREGSISEAHASGVNGVPIVNLLEVKARMPGVLSE